MKTTPSQFFERGAGLSCYHPQLVSLRLKEFIMGNILRGHIGLMTTAMIEMMSSDDIFRSRKLSQEEFLREEHERREKVAVPYREERARRKAEAWEKRQSKKKGQLKVASSFLKQIAFPECSKKCAALEMLGACECESICGWKFHSCDKSQSRKGLTQKELDELYKG